MPVLQPLLPDAGLRRGTTVSVSSSTSLALALLAGPSAAGSWCTAVGLPSLGLAAAAELGVALERFPMVAAPASRPEWATVVAAVLDAFDVVLARPPVHVRPTDARRLSARARERGAVLVLTGDWPHADVRLAVVATEWTGLGRGHGRLSGRRVEIVGGGRGAAARERRAALWLPAPTGGIEPVSGFEGDDVRRLRQVG